MKLRFSICILFIVVVCGFSCTTYKSVPYFQDLKKDSVTTEVINNYKPLTIMPGDLLALYVTSMNREADAIFNYNLERPSGTDPNADANATPTPAVPGESLVYGYLVDQNGDIHLPVLGLVHVAGMSTSQISTDLEGKLSSVLSNPVVNVRLQNFRISILGDVKSPGIFNVPKERVTVTEALAMAGDLNTTGIRNVLLVREVDGNRKYITLDLTSKQTFNSPYFYLRNNDLLYVQPNKAKVTSNDNTFEKVSLALAVISILVYLIKK